MKLRHFIINPIAYILLYFVFFIQSSVAQSTYRIKHFGNENGIKNGVVTSFFQDINGFLWIGSENGLYRFDGYTFLPFTTNITDSLSIPNNVIYGINQDKKKRIWITTQKGVCIYNNINGSFIRINEKNKQKKDIRIMKTICAPTGDIWFVNTENGLWYYDEFHKLIKNYKGGKNVADYTATITINKMISDEIGNLWIFSPQKGIAYLNIKSDKVISHPEIPINEISDIVFTSKNEVCISTRKELYVYDESKNKFSSIPYPNSTPKPIIFADKSNHLKLCIPKLGFYDIDIASKSIKRVQYTLEDERLSSKTNFLFVDRNDNIWLAQQHDGISIIQENTNPFLFFTKPEIGQYDKIIAVCPTSENTFIVCSEAKGLHEFNLKTGSFTPKAFGEIQNITNFTTCIKDLNGIIWLGTESNGLIRYNPQDNSVRFLSSFNKDIEAITSLFVDSRNQIIMGIHNKGIFSFDDKTQKIHQLFRDTNQTINTISEDNAGNIIFGSNDGLYKIKGNKAHRICLDSNCNGSEIITALRNDKKGNIWVGSSKGLFQYQAHSEKAISLNNIETNINQTISSIIEDANGYIWIFYTHTISRLHPQSKKISSFTINHGIKETDFSSNSASLFDSNKIIIGGVKGITVILPSIAKQTKPTKTNISITNIYLANKSVYDYNTPSMTDKLSFTNNTLTDVFIDYTDNPISIEFSALDYALSDEIIYKYKIDGIDKDWIITGANHRVASYSNLPVGTYTFHVKATNSLGEWQNDEKILIIHISAPFWKAKWFYLLLFLGLAAVITLFYMTRLSNLTRIRTLLERQVEHRTHILEQQNIEIERQKAEIKEQRDNVTDQKLQIEEQSGILAHQKEELEKSQIMLEEVLSHRKSDLENAKQKAMNYEKNISNITQYFTNISKAISEVIIIMNIQEETYEFVSENIIDITGYTAEEIKADSLLYRKLIADECRDDFSEHRKRIAQGNVINQFEYRIINKNGDSKWLLQKNAIILNSNNEPELLQAIISDITSTKTEAPSSQKTGISFIEDTSRLKSALIDKISQEIRGPMNSIIGFTDLLVDPEITHNDKKAFIENISNSSDSMLHLIDDIIDLSKIEAGNLEISYSRCYINQMLIELQKSFEKIKSLNNKQDIGILVQLPIDDEHFSIMTDTHRLKQIMMNLIGNAIKYTEHGSIEFGYEITNENETHEVSELTFYVKDTGIGIPQHLHNELFDHTKILNDITSKRSFSNGIGLALTRKLTELLGGSISFESEVNKGTCFRIKLPIVQKNIVKPITENSAFVMPDWSRKTILVAEDEENNYKFISAALSRTKATLLWAHDGIEAVDFIRQRRKDIDLVLMDMQMPQMNGFDATKAIKKIERTVPIIAQTAFAMSGGKIKCFEAGCDGYISKPYKVKDLIETITKHI